MEADITLSATNTVVAKDNLDPAHSDEDDDDDDDDLGFQLVRLDMFDDVDEIKEGRRKATKVNREIFMMVCLFVCLGFSRRGRCSIRVRTNFWTSPSATP